jgi:hypothetical protein
MTDVRTKRFGLALVITLIVTLIGALLPGPAIAGPAQSLPAQYALGYDPSAPPGRGFTAPTFTFDDPSGILDLPEPPDPQTSPEQYQVYEDYLDELGPPGNYTSGSPTHFWARWKLQLASGKKTTFRAYRAQYVNMTNNRIRGKQGFEPFVRGNEPLFAEPGWRFDRGVPGTGTTERPDTFNDDIPFFYEFKASADLRNDGGKQLSALFKIAVVKDKTGFVLFQEPPSADALRQIEDKNRELPENKGIPAGQPLKREAIIGRYYPATAVGIPIPDDKTDKTGKAVPSRPNWNPPTSGGAAAPPGGSPITGGPSGGALAAPGQHSADGGLSDAVAASPDSADDAAQRAEATQDIATQDAKELGPDYDPGDATTNPLGGVDFSTLQLRYVSDSYQGHAAQFAFKADATPEDQPSYGGKQAAKLASDSFFVWLELPVDAFTVNLNPDEPERIIDSQFGRTDAGRVLLQADLQMKKTTAQLIDPDTPLGRQFWDSLHGGENKCLSSRSWIVPGTATVHDDGNELYILDAPLTVKTESDYLSSTGAGDTSCAKNADSEYNQEIYRSTILPLIQKKVNEAPEYADLRRVYFSRVAAQWYRDRARTKHTAYSDLVDKGNISRWVTREKWTPKDTYDLYVKSYKEGEFHRTYTTTQGDTVLTETYIFGGVDFSTINENHLGGGAFAGQQPGLPQAVTNAQIGAVPGDGGKNVWLGGMTADRPITELAFSPPTPAPSTTIFYVLAGAPVLAWLLAGAWILVRRRRSAALGGAS